MTRKSLGEFEQQILLTLLHLGGEAYSVAIVLEMTKRSGHEVAQSAVFIVLRRLEDKGLVASRIEDGSETGTGRTRRYFKVQTEGMERLKEVRRRTVQPGEGAGEVLGCRPG